MVLDDRKLHAWRTIDLEWNAAIGNWIGSVELKGNASYFVQAVDAAGNVGIFSDSGADLAGSNAPYGSTWSGPKSFEILLPDEDGDGLPTAWETGHPCLSASIADAIGDPDSDLLTSTEEFDLDLDPCVDDTDGGGDNDGSEQRNGRSPSSLADDRLLTISVDESDGGTTIDWGNGLGQNGSIDGPYWIYRSASPAMNPTDLRDGTPLPDGTTSTTDGTAGTWYFDIRNARLATPAPTIDVLSPSVGSTSGGTAIRVYGTGFVAGGVVKVCGALATGVSFVSSFRLDAITPAHAPGPCSIEVVNPNGQIGIKDGAFAYQ